MAISIFDDPAKQNWISVLYSFACLAEGITPYTRDEFAKLHAKFQGFTRHIHTACSSVKPCSHERYLRDWCQICEEWREIIIKARVHDSYGSDWSKVDSTKWPSDSLEIEKCFHPDWCSKKASATNDGDISVILGKLNNCKDIKSALSVSPFDMRESRNKVVHNTNISTTDKERYCEAMMNFLKDPAIWCYQEARESYDKIKLFKEKTYMEIITNETIKEHDLHKYKLLNSDVLTHLEVEGTRAMICYLLMRMKSTQAIIAAVILFLGIVLCCLSIFQNVYHWQNEIVGAIKRHPGQNEIVGAIERHPGQNEIVGAIERHPGQNEIVGAIERLPVDDVIHPHTGQSQQQQDIDMCGDVQFVSREKWGAKQPKSTEHMATPVSIVFVHHTVTAHCNNLLEGISIVKSIQNYHMDTKPCVDIGYNFLIGEDGRVYEGRGWNKVGAHTVTWNTVSVSFAFMGNFEKKEAAPLAIDALKGILSYGVSQGLLSPNYKMYGHRDAINTKSPGDKLYSQIKIFDHFDHNKPVKPTN